MNQYSYLIMVEVPADGPMEDLVKALRAAYDNGSADGQYQVVITREPGYMVAFLRTAAEDDLQYLRDRMKAGSETLKLAAMHQLGAELQECVGVAAAPVIADLLNGDAQVIDFNGVLSAGQEGI